ncbi:aldehyde dehydrogenase family protein, partial [Nocardia abscessus]|uniref:aldehyde dehydrogenase family protein n=1 Tax=Nocardia abscessus TaxID=120957 RepID=UPI002457B6F2
LRRAALRRFPRLLRQRLHLDGDLAAGWLDVVQHPRRRPPPPPDGLAKGYYVQPTVFANVTNDMTIAREEIFGPVLAILGYDSLDHAVDIANDTEYGLAGNVAGADVHQARAVARRIRSGWITINDAFDFHAPFGGYRKSGNGREWGEFGFHDYLETKAILGYAPDEAGS